MARAPLAWEPPGRGQDRPGPAERPARRRRPLTHRSPKAGDRSAVAPPRAQRPAAVTRCPFHSTPGVGLEFSSGVGVGSIVVGPAVGAGSGEGFDVGVGVGFGVGVGSGVGVGVGVGGGVGVGVGSGVGVGVGEGVGVGVGSGVGVGESGRRRRSRRRVSAQASASAKESAWAWETVLGSAKELASVPGRRPRSAAPRRRRPPIPARRAPRRSCSESHPQGRRSCRCRGPGGHTSSSIGRCHRSSTRRRDCCCLDWDRSRSRPRSTSGREHRPRDCRRHPGRPPSGSRSGRCAIAMDSGSTLTVVPGAAAIGEVAPRATVAASEAATVATSRRLRRLRAGTIGASTSGSRSPRS